MIKFKIKNNTANCHTIHVGGKGKRRESKEREKGENRKKDIESLKKT